MLNKNTEYKVKGYTNRWAIIDTFKGYALLENSTWGDETCYLVAKLNQEPQDLKYKKSNGNIIVLPTIIDILCETFDGLEVALEDESII